MAGNSNSGRKANPMADTSHMSKKQAQIRLDTLSNAGPFVGSLPCPSDMSETAKKEWRRIMREYAKMPAQMLTKLDVAPLRQYCELFAQFYEAEQKWIKDLHCAVASTDETTQKVIDAIRKTLIEDNRLEAVVSMPSGVFKPYAGVSTAVLIFTKTGHGHAAHRRAAPAHPDGQGEDGHQPSHPRGPGEDAGQPPRRLPLHEERGH